jgi:hypothetical protein
MFPTAWWLGPLRWYIPWKAQAGLAWLGGCVGYKPIMKDYTDEGVWKEFVRGKRIWQ